MPAPPTPEGPPPPQQLLMQMMMAKMTTQALSVLAELSVADKLAGGAQSVNELAESTGADADSLYRVLRAAAAVGVFTELPGRRFENNDISQFMRGDVPGSMRAMVRWINAPCSWAAWGRLDHSVKTGKPAFDEVHQAQVFEFFREHPDAGRVFNEAMTSVSGMSAEAITTAYDFGALPRIVDVGGGHGALLCAIMRAYDGPSGIVFDLPEVVEGTSELLIASGLAARIDTTGGDFFEQVPAGADAYLLKAIIHDWDDEHCIKIRDNCRRAMNEGGRVLILERVVTNTPAGVPAKLLDLEMLVMTTGGRERTADEYRTLLAKAGLTLKRIVPTQSALSIVEAFAT